jgi:tetratricopeptide (TPR) repeat protein
MVLAATTESVCDDDPRWLSGKVVDANNRGVGGIVVRIQGKTEARTDRNGAFKIQLPSGIEDGDNVQVSLSPDRWLITNSRDGTITIPGNGDLITLTVALRGSREALAPALDGIAEDLVENRIESAANSFGNTPTRGIKVGNSALLTQKARYLGVTTEELTRAIQKWTSQKTLGTDYDTGIAALYRSDYVKAIEILGEASRLSNGKQGKALLLLGSIHLQLLNLRPAGEAFEKALQLDPVDIAALLGIIDVCGLQDERGIEDNYNTDDSDSDLYELFGNCDKYIDSDYVKAFRDRVHALKPINYPSEVFAITLAGMLSENDDHEQSGAELATLRENAELVHPDNLSDVLTVIGGSLAVVGRMDEAKETFEEARAVGTRKNGVHFPQKAHILRLEAEQAATKTENPLDISSLFRSALQEALHSQDFSEASEIHETIAGLLTHLSASEEESPHKNKPTIHHLIDYHYQRSIALMGDIQGPKSLAALLTRLQYASYLDQQHREVECVNQLRIAFEMGSPFLPESSKLSRIIEARLIEHAHDLAAEYLDNQTPGKADPLFHLIISIMEKAKHSFDDIEITLVDVLDEYAGVLDKQGRRLEAARYKLRANIARERGSDE